MASDDSRERLSAFADGQTEGLNADQAKGPNADQATGLSAEQAVAQWKADAQARSDWHAWHLVGDVLRSEELGSAPGRDEAFLQSLRERLRAEPAVLAPRIARGPAPAALRRWRAPLAAAAGVAAVAVVVLSLQNLTAEAPPLLARPSVLGVPGPTTAPVAMGEPANGVVPVAQTPSSAASLPGAFAGSTSSAASSVRSAPTSPDQGPLIRDPRLDEALRAQRDGATATGPAPGRAGVDRVSAPK